MAETIPENSTHRIYNQIRDILSQARARVWQAVNHEMVCCYWEIGRVLVEEEQQGEERAEYGKRVIQELSKRLTSEFGKGFDRSNLWNMRLFYLAYPKIDAVRRELSWTHYRILLRVEKPESRAFYENEAINARWSTRELERQIASLLFERLALSRDKSGVLGLARKGHEIITATDLIKDPYVLEFVGLRQDENPPIGIILCSEKSEAVVRYTLPEGNNQIFASRYKLYLPSEEELAAEICKERQVIELEKRITGDSPDDK